MVNFYNIREKSFIVSKMNYEQLNRDKDIRRLSFI